MKRVYQFAYLISLGVLLLSACSKKGVQLQRSAAELRVLSQSSFHQGEIAPEVALLSAIQEGGEGGVIGGGGSGGTTGDGGVIGGGDSSHGGGTSGGVSSSGTAGGGSSGGSTGVVIGGGAGGTTGGSATGTSTGGETQGSGAGSGTSTSGAGGDGGTVIGGSSGTSTGDGGTVIGGSSGASTGDGGGLTGGASGGSASGTSSGGSSGGASSGTVVGGTSGNTGGNTGASSGTAGGSAGGSTSGSATGDGGTVVGGSSGSTSGDGGGVTGGASGGSGSASGTGSASGGTSGTVIGGTSGGSQGSGSGTTGGTAGTSSGSTGGDGGTVVGGSGGSTGSGDGGTVVGGSSGASGGNGNGMTSGGTSGGGGGTTGGSSGTVVGGSSGGGTGATSGGTSGGGTTGSGTTGGGTGGGGSGTGGGCVASHLDNDTCVERPDLTIRFSRVCSIRRSQAGDLFFEDARHPILSIEATVPRTREAARSPYLSAMGYVTMVSIVRDPSDKNYPGSSLIQELIVSESLAGANLLENKDFKLKLKLHAALERLKQQYPEQWQSSVVYVRVCDDKNGNGRCSDEDYRRTLTVSAPSFRVDRVPRSLTVDVWSGRYLTRASDPEYCEKQYSPIVLDLTGRGIKLSGPEQGVQFDLNDTGEPIYTGWIASTENALLARDLNRNGRIDSGAELFGNATRLKTGARALNGFEAMIDLDDDQDKLLTPADSAWGSLLLWLDRNFNGQTERGELLPLRHANIRYFNLNYVDMMEVDAFGNQTRQRSTYTRVVRGKSYPLLMIDVWFNTLVER